MFSDQSKVIHSEMSLSPEEFENYQVGVDTEITFCLKELRVRSLNILSHASKVGSPTNHPGLRAATRHGASDPLVRSQVDYMLNTGT